MTDISVIIPSFKPADYIYECLKSITEQTLNKERFEVIIILNGCNEPYYTNINNYIIEHDLKSNTKLIQTDISGVSNARNIGLDTARGKYVVFIDDDDFISPQYLSGLLAKADEKTISLSNAIAFYDSTKQVKENYYMKNTFNLIKKEKHISLFKSRALFNVIYMKIIPTNIINNVRFNSNFNNGEDALFMYEISKNIKNINVTNSSSVYYRRYRLGSAVTTRRKINQMIHNSLNLFLAILKIWGKQPFKYKFIFTISRLIACLKGIITDIAFQKNQ